MNALADMTEKQLHDRFEGHGFSAVAASGDGVVDECPFRESDFAMDYRQPGFQFRKMREGVFTFDWPSFVEDLQVETEEWTADDGSQFYLVAQVDFDKAPDPLYPGRLIAEGRFRMLSAAVGVYDSSRPPPSYTGQDEAGEDVLVTHLGSVIAGEFVPTLNFSALGHLFLSRPGLRSLFTLEPV